MEAKVQGPNDDEVQPFLLPLSFSLQEGEQLVLGRTPSGARTYLAVRGGWATPSTIDGFEHDEQVEVDLT